MGNPHGHGTGHLLTEATAQVFQQRLAYTTMHEDGPSLPTKQSTYEYSKILVVTKVQVPRPWLDTAAA